MKAFVKKLRKRAADQPRLEKGLIAGLAVSTVVTVLLALSLVWLNMEQTRLAYRAHEKQRILDGYMELNAKLEVEYNYLMSPQELSRQAATMGLRPAQPGEIRRMRSFGETPIRPEVQEEE